MAMIALTGICPRFLYSPLEHNSEPLSTWEELQGAQSPNNVADTDPSSWGQDALWGTRPGMVPRMQNVATSANGDSKRYWGWCWTWQ
ncbi:hypothetical protein N7457_001877 [Penicillium paradoxum]|uniref:uncharacterized protein n=1 Tax=Penicillium paradoxum TaxID=176176 RepID=UPI00254996CA|nr:uncharacterized protein N7457_001877 [Penicillium paradoxum]KAJ5795278.1 hypothetical protein N7457_001877 [Penicillium paradoxum]